MLSLGLVRACSVSEIPPGQMKWVRVEGRDLLIANTEGGYHAVDNWCTHEQGNLSKGELRKHVLTCPDHGAQFDLKNGHVLNGPEGETAESISALRSYKIVIQGDDILVEID